MRKGEGLSIGKVHESLRKRAGEVLVVIAGIALAASGCAAPTPCNAEQQGQENPTADTGTDPRGYPDLDWKIVDAGCYQGNTYCETGEPESATIKACDGTTLLYEHEGGIAAIPNSPECSYTPSAENSPAPTTEATPASASGE